MNFCRIACFISISFSASAAFAGPVTKVVCGKMTSIERTTAHSLYDITLKLKFSQNGVISRGKLKLASSVQRSARTLTLSPATADDTLRAMTVFSGLLTYHSIGGALCISFPNSPEAIRSGFAYEFGTGNTVEKAASDLEAVQKFSVR